MMESNNINQTPDEDKIDPWEVYQFYREEYVRLQLERHEMIESVYPNLVTYLNCVYSELCNAHWEVSSELTELKNATKELVEHDALIAEMGRACDQLADEIENTVGKTTG